VALERASAELREDIPNCSNPWSGIVEGYLTYRQLVDSPRKDIYPTYGASLSVARILQGVSAEAISSLFSTLQ
jgi:hypothetical protein